MSDIGGYPTSLTELPAPGRPVPFPPLSGCYATLFQVSFRSFRVSYFLHSIPILTPKIKVSVRASLDSKEITPVNPKGNQPWIFIGRTDAEAEAPILWLPDAQSWLTGKDNDSGKDWGQEENEATKDEMVGRPSSNQWTRVWANSRRWWWTGKPGMLQFMGSQRVGHDLAMEQQLKVSLLSSEMTVEKWISVYKFCKGEEETQVSNWRISLE